jgi:Immunoglobulin I-set domain
MLPQSQFAVFAYQKMGLVISLLLLTCERPFSSIETCVSLSARLLCSQVSWIRRRDAHILAVDRYTFIADERFQAFHVESTDTWTLQIKYVQARDAGQYECQISTEPKMSHFITLNVVGEWEADGICPSIALHQFHIPTTSTVINVSVRSPCETPGRAKWTVCGTSFVTNFFIVDNKSAPR